MHRESLLTLVSLTCLTVSLQLLWPSWYHLQQSVMAQPWFFVYLMDVICAGKMHTSILSFHVG